LHHFAARSLFVCFLARYAKPPELSTVATTGSGQVVVGDLKGEIRMFSDISKRAKTHLPGLGGMFEIVSYVLMDRFIHFHKNTCIYLFIFRFCSDGVIGIDVTEDGKWVLATTEAYLLLIPTMTSAGKSGFQASMGKEKPNPIKLVLKPEDLVKLGIDEVKITPARFNIGENITEDWIVTSTGPFIITWNFKKIRQGKGKDDYKVCLK